MFNKILLFGDSFMTNPLKQYFRRPAIYLRLPSEGKFYSQGSIDLPDNKEIPVYPMTAIDEITTKTPDMLFNGTAVIEIIKSCVPNIKNPWDIPQIDLDPILVAIRAATNGNDMDIESTCPSCQEESSYGVNLTGLLTSLKSGDYDNEVLINDLKFKFRPLSYKQINQINMAQFEIQNIANNLDKIEDEQARQAKTTETMHRLTELSMGFVSEAIEHIATPSAFVIEKEYILDFLKNCDKQTFEELRKKTIELRQTSEIKPLKIKCIKCEHQYEQSIILNATDFFG
jgi:hypothetical protein